MAHLKLDNLYLSGPMAGKKDHNYPAFNAEAARLRSLGYKVTNPAELDTSDCREWADFLKRDIVYLLKCDSIALMPGWQASRGASLEYTIAADLGMRVLFIADITE